MTDADWMPTLYSKVVLNDETNATKLFGSNVILEIDRAYTIGKSIAVIREENVIGHLDKSASRVIWRFLRSNSRIVANLYTSIHGWQNQRSYSALTYSHEIGVKISFPDLGRSEGKLLLAHVARHKLNCFPGVTPWNCPEALKLLVRPIKDENGVTSLLISSVNW